MAAEKRLLKPIVDPLFEIRPARWSAPSADQYDAIMFTSTNAIKTAGPKLLEYRDLPVLAVGEVTANAAREAGFQIEVTGNGGVQALVDTLVDRSFLNILRLVGRDYTAVQTEQNIDTIAVYQSVDIGLGENARRSLISGCIVLLHSTKAAQSLTREIAETEISRADNHVIAISTKAAKAAGTGWKSITVAEEPTDDALLSAAARLCSG